MAVVALADEVARDLGQLDRAADLDAAGIADVGAQARENRPIALLEIGDAPRQRRQRDRIGADIHLALAIAQGEGAAAARRQHEVGTAGDDGGDAGGVVASIFQTLQGIDQEVRDRPLAQNADDAAHDVDQRFFGFFGVWRARNDFAQPGFSLWRSRAIASASAATLLVTVLPAATKLPSPRATGATSVALEPMKAPAPMVVRCLAKPS